MKIFIIIPCYNEAENISAVLRSVLPYGIPVVVDDGSKDQTAKIASQNGAMVLRHIVNRGMGAALETGNRYAYNNGADIAVHFDGDGQHSAEEIPRIIRPIIEGGADVVLGSRFLKENNTPFIKKWLILKTAIFFQNFLLKVKLTDAHNGFRALSAKALGKINLRQDGMAHATEIIEQIVKLGIKHVEAPVTVSYKEFGQGFLEGMQIVKDLLFGKINRN